ncbi:MAG: phosphotransferase [Planctomycetes bacterium]|nr:phosphotransferase [Planctomycetota bacterium]
MTEKDCPRGASEDAPPDPGTDEYPLALAARVASRFRLPSPVEAFDFPEKGNINQQTFLIESGRGEPACEYLLQRINQQVFTRPRSVMAAMIASLEAQRRNLERGLVPAGRQWETITLVPTRGGEPYLEAASRRGVSFWRLMVKISECRTYKSLAEISSREERLRVAEEAGCGLAIYGDLTSGMDISALASPLPGYRDTRLYYDQLEAVLQGCRSAEDAEPLLPQDEDLRHSTQQHFLLHLPEAEHERRRGDPQLRRFIELALAERDFGLTLLRGMETGRIRRVAIHGDTKLDNFLFSTRTGQALSLIDLDTIMPHTWLADWGDMVRSLANVAGEKERNLERVQVDMEIYEALARGFLAAAREVTPEEVSLMPEGVQIIALELGIRFLADYLRGDSYFKLSGVDPPDLNKVRAMAQLTLFERLREKEAETRRAIARFSASGA